MVVISSKVAECIEKYFKQHALWICRYRLWFLVVPILLTLFLMAGWHKFKMERDMTVLFSPGGSKWHHDRLKFEKFFGLDEASMKYLLIATKAEDGNLFDEPMNSELLKVLDDIETKVYVTDENGKHYHYFPDLATDKSPYLGPNEIIKALFIGKEELRSHLRYPVITRAGQTLFLPFAFGGVTTYEEEPDKVKRVRCLLMRYAAIAKDKKYEDLSDRFETAMFDYATALPANSTLDVSVYSWWSIMNEIRQNTWHTLRYVPPAMFMTLVFTVLVCSTKDWRSSCHMHAMFGLLSVMMSFVSALGFLFWFGYYYNDLVSITSFLALAVGVDDTFILLSAWRRKIYLADKPEKRMQETLIEAGTSITFTSITDVLAFGVGMTMQVPALRNFCTFTALAIGWDYLYQVTFFPAAMLYAEDWRHKSKGLFVWMFGDQENATEAIQTLSPNHKVYAINGIHAVTDVNTKIDDNCNQVNVTVNGQKNIDNVGLKVKRGKLSFLSSEETFQEIFAQWCTNVIVNFPCQIVLFIIYIGLTVVALVGISKMELNASFSKLLVDSSPMHRYVDLFDTYFWSESNLFHCVVKSPDLRNVTQVKRFYEFVHELENTPYSFGADSTVLWLKEFYSYVYFFEELEFDEIDPKRIPWLLQKFLGEESSFSERDAHFEPIDPDDPKSYVLPSRFQFATGFKGLPKWPERADLLEIITEVEVKYADFEPAFFHEMIFLTDLLIYTRGGMKQTLGTVLIVTFAITLLFLPTGRGSLVFWVTTTFVWINCVVIGMLSWWWVDVDVISMVTVLMSVGFSVDYTVHLAYQYSRTVNEESGPHAHLMSRALGRHRVLETLRSVGLPILLAGLSTLTAVGLMVCVGSYMVRVFLKTLVIVVASGLFQSLLMLPLVLMLTERRQNQNRTNAALKSKRVL